MKTYDEHVNNLQSTKVFCLKLFQKLKLSSKKFQVGRMKRSTFLSFGVALILEEDLCPSQPAMN